MQGSNSIRYKFCWTHAQYKDVAKLWPFTKQWWNQVPTPLRVKVTRGHSGQALDDDARGKPLPPGFAPVLRHFGHISDAPNITQEGLKPGIICGKSSKSCVHFSIDVYDPTLYKEAQEQLAKGDLQLPARVGYPPRSDYDCELILNFDAVFDSGAMLSQEEGFAVTSKANFTVPWQCIEAAFTRKSRIILLVNPAYYGKWLPRPTPNYPDIFSSTGASSSSSSMPATTETGGICSGG